jgi:hypothetical protein
MPISEAQVARMINRLPSGGRLGGRREVKELPNILWDDEEILDVVQGVYNNGIGILVSTQRRLLFVDKGVLGALKVEDFPLDKITSFQYSIGMVLGEITVYASGNKAVIRNVDKTQAKTFCESARARIAMRDAARSEGASGSARASAGGLVDELARLAKLFDDGLLTQDEFTAAKRNLIGFEFEDKSGGSTAQRESARQIESAGKATSNARSTPPPSPGIGAAEAASGVEKKCLKCGHKAHVQRDPAAACPSCGAIYQKEEMRVGSFVLLFLVVMAGLFGWWMYSSLKTEERVGAREGGFTSSSTTASVGDVERRCRAIGGSIAVVAIANLSKLKDVGLDLTRVMGEGCVREAAKHGSACVRHCESQFKAEAGTLMQ